jgi:hypothetical protein
VSNIDACSSEKRFIAQNILFCTNELGEGLVKNLQNKRNAELKPKYNFFLNWYR